MLPQHAPSAKEMKILARAFVDKASIQEDGTLEAVVASTPIEDRHGETIDQAGWDLKNFKQNPILLWAHGLFSQPPIGKVEKIWIDGENKSAKLMFKPRFDLNDPFASEVFRKINEGFLNTFSVGFMPIEQDGPHYIKQELLEISAVNVPANPQARVVVRSAGGEEFQPTTFEELQKQLNAGDISVKPYENEHSCRLRDPGDFKDGSFRSYERDHEGKKYRVIAGRLKGEDTMTEQAFRYSKGTWDADAARKHCQSHDGSFEAAKALEEEMEKEKVKAMINEAVIEAKKELENAFLFKEKSEKERKDFLEALKIINQSTAHMLGVLKADSHPAEKVT